MSDRSAVPARRRVAGALRFELERRLTARSTVLALGAFAVIVAVGAWRGPAPAAGGEPPTAFLGYAWTVAALALLRFGAGGDRRHRFGACLAGNFLSAGELFLARTAAYGVTALALGALTLAAGTVLVGSPARAAWHAAEYTLVAGLAAPAVVVVELALGVRAPFAAVLLLFLAALLLAEPFVGAEAVIRAVGLPAAPPGPASLQGLALRTALVLPTGLGALGLLLRRRGPATGDRPASR